MKKPIQYSLSDLIDEDYVFMGSDWVKDPTIVDGPMKGHRYKGTVPCVNCNDVFFWGCADAEEIRTDDELSFLNQCIDDCNGDVFDGCMLYCARRRKERPQGAMYSSINKQNWHLFNECGPEREVGLGNPYKIGEYK